MFKKRKRKTKAATTLTTTKPTDSNESNVPSSLPLILKQPPIKKRTLQSHQSSKSSNSAAATAPTTTFSSDRSSDSMASTSATAGRIEDHTTTKKFGQSHGPMKASSNVRTTTRFDYDPSICKDYKETGTCGYGDSCIYLHDRSDYKSGWQIEKEYNDSRSLLVREGVGGATKKTSTEQGDAKEDTLPFACYICREAFTRPVVTRCGHYFCEKCALKRFAKEKKRDCAVCGVVLDGNFKQAKGLNLKVKE